MKIDHIQLAIPAGAEDPCRAFWVGVLGFQELVKPTALQARGGAWFRYGETEIHLGVEREFTPAKKAHPALLVTDFEKLADKIALAGHPVHWDDKIANRRRFFTDDPVGNRIEFIESN